MRKPAKEVVKGDVIKVHWGAAPFPVWHEVFSVFKDGEQLRITVKTSWGTEPLNFDDDEIVEVED